MAELSITLPKAQIEQRPDSEQSATLSPNKGLTATAALRLRKLLSDSLGENLSGAETALGALAKQIRELGKADEAGVSSFVRKENVVSKLLQSFAERSSVERQGRELILKSLPGNALDEAIGKRIVQLSSKDSTAVHSAVEEIGLIAQHSALGQLGLKARDSVKRLTSIVESGDQALQIRSVDALNGLAQGLGSAKVVTETFRRAGTVSSLMAAFRE